MKTVKSESPHRRNVSAKLNMHIRAGSPDSSTNDRVISVLNHILANEFSLFTKTLNFHWNITGKSFHSLHVFLGAQYKELLGLMDELAERVRVLGGRPLSTVAEFQNISEIKESPGDVPSEGRMLSELLADHFKLQSLIKESLDEEQLFRRDRSTEDMLVDVLKKHELMAWMLKSHVIDESHNEGSMQ